MQNNKKILALISLGAILEYYDFAIFIYLAPLVAKSLIPVNDKLTNMVLGYTVFAIGALFRPLGGLIFAHIGDTRGRSTTFTYTILFMALPTFCIAFIPNVEQIGIVAVILLLILRVMQGMAIGGEIPGSIVFGYEIADAKYKPINSAIVVMGTNIGFLLASIICAILVDLNLQFASWRIAFIIGGLFGILSYFLRKNLRETKAFINYQKIAFKGGVPVKKLISYHYKSVFQLLGISLFLASTLSVFTFYLPIYLATFYSFPIAKLLQFNSYVITIYIIGSLIAGFYDKYFGKIFLIVFITIFTIFVFWLFPAFGSLTLDNIMSINIIVLLMVGIVCGRLPVLAASFFPIGVRYTGIALVYNISFGIVAGSTQMVLTWFIAKTNLLWIPALYIAIFSILSIISLLTIKSDRLINYQL